MSGPKSADYDLTAERRRLLAEQRCVNKLKSKIEKYASCSAYAQSEMALYAAHASESLQVASTDHHCFELLTEFDTVIKALKATFEHANMMNDTFSLTECLEKIKNLKAKKESLLSNIKFADSQNISMLKKEYDHQLKETMSTDFGSIKSKSQSELEELLLQMQNKLTEVKMLPNLSEELCCEIDDVKKRTHDFKSISLLRNFNAITVEPLVKRCEEYTKQYSEFEELSIEYQSLCEAEQIKPQVFQCCQEESHRLKGMIEELRSSSIQAEEQAYISNAIDEVMMEIGYQLIGNRSVTKKNGRRFRSELYTFSEGTAVNITHSSNGQIAMELAGIDTTDRQPTDAESNLLCTEMENFCVAFSEFEKRLAEKGVISKHISLLPPTSEYAQIININDYEIQKTTNFSELRANKMTAVKKANRME